MTTRKEFAAWNGRGLIQNLVTELERQARSRIDFVADSRQLEIETQNSTANGGRNVMVLQPRSPQTEEFLPREGVEVEDHAWAQVFASTTPEVPTAFGRKFVEYHDSMAGQVITDFWAAYPKRRLVRLLDGKVRAFLSDKYRVVDNYDLSFAALEVAKDCNARVLEASLSPRNMRIKFTSPDIVAVVDEHRAAGGNWYSGGLGNAKFLQQVGAITGGQLPGGPGTLHPLVTISNSETGHGRLDVWIGLLRAVCFNVATVETVVSEVHLGQTLPEGVMSAETREAASKVQLLSIRDSIKAAFDQKHFERLVAKATAAAEVPISAPSAAVENIVKLHNWSDEKRDDLLRYFGAEAPTKWGLSQAVARMAQDFDNADDAAEAERVAGNLLAV